MKIAIIGSGISGLTCAHVLAKKHEVHLFEVGSYVGGHTATVDVEVTSGRYAIDTGFIVFNDWTYPNFIRLMDELKVESQPSSMSFSVKCLRQGLEYNGTSLNSLFAQRRNLFRPSFYRMIKDILRFNKESLEVLDDSTGDGLTLGEYLKEKGYSREFKHHYIVPMGSAIWSASEKQMDEFPMKFFIRFFKNHGMLSVDERPVWRVIRGGSRSYVAPLIRPFKDKVHLNAKVLEVTRAPGHVNLRVSKEGEVHTLPFDHVIFATHSDETMKILKDPTPEEKDVMGGFSYQPNSVILHTDASVLPKRRLAWAAWNYLLPELPTKDVALTYNMNILQNLNAPETFCVSLNMDDVIDPKKVLRKFTYDHPVFTSAAVKSQGRWSEISGKNRTHFCGAYWRNGFHEDGVVSALNVCGSFGEAL